MWYPDGLSCWCYAFQWNAGGKRTWGEGTAKGETVRSEHMDLSELGAWLTQTLLAKRDGGGIASCLNTNYDLIFDVMIFSGAEGEQDCLSPTTQLTESPQNLLCILFWVFMNSRFWVKLTVRYILIYLSAQLFTWWWGDTMIQKWFISKFQLQNVWWWRDCVHSLLWYMWL